MSLLYQDHVSAITVMSH